MTSRRKRKKVAASLSLSERELMLAELCEELLDEIRWMQILSYSNQYLMNRHLKIDADERDRILEASTRTVDKDAKLHEWRERLARVKSDTLELERGVKKERQAMAKEAQRAARAKRAGGEASE